MVEVVLVVEDSEMEDAAAAVAATIVDVTAISRESVPTTAAVIVNAEMIEVVIATVIVTTVAPVAGIAGLYTISLLVHFITPADMTLFILTITKTTNIIKYFHILPAGSVYETEPLNPSS